MAGVDKTEALNELVAESQEGLTRDQMLRFAYQQLESFSRFGLLDLPKPAGEYEFEFESDAADSDSEVEGQSEGSASPSAATSGRKVELQPVTLQKSRQTDASKPADSVAESPAVPVAPVSAGPPAPVTAPVSPAPSSVLNIGVTEPYPAVSPAAERPHALELLQEKVAACTACEQLCKSRTQTVFGVGNPSARLVFLGEGPGAEEDRAGEPFVGAAGQLLDKIINACKMTRDDVYILNTVKCRPPANRNPSESELANCWGYAIQQLEILQPEFICCLGSVAAKTLLQTKQSVSKMRQKFFQYRGSRVIVTYHPAYLLRQANAKQHVWNDMKMLMLEMGVEL